MGAVTSYARARAESLGMQAKGGIAERADRLVAILVMTGLGGALRPADPDVRHHLGARGGQHRHRGPADPDGRRQALARSTDPAAGGAA